MKPEAAIAHIPRLRRYARLLTGDGARADDLVQDTLERAVRKWTLWRAPPEGDAAAALRRWLLTLMHNLHANQRRDRGWFDQHAELDAGNEPLHEPHAATAQRLDLERGLATLAPPLRETLLLVSVESCSYAEAAEILGVPVGTVMSRLSRARAQLRERLEGAPSRASLRVVK